MMENQYERQKEAVSWDSVKQYLRSLVGRNAVDLDEVSTYLNQVSQTGAVPPEEVKDFYQSIVPRKKVITWSDAKEYAKNVLDKVRRKFTVFPQEEKIVKSLPPEVVEEAKQELAQEPLATSDTKFTYVDEHAPSNHPMTPEEKQELVAKSPEVQVLNTFIPEILDSNVFFQEAEARHIDASFNTFGYLQSLGYPSAYWSIGPEHNAMLLTGKERHDACRPVINGMPICDLLNGQLFTVSNILDNARAHASRHGYFPPKPVIAMSHPGCRCHFVCTAPPSVDSIPDTAPGVPTSGTPEEKRAYKEQIFGRLQDFYVDRWTVLSEEIYNAASTSNVETVDTQEVDEAENEEAEGPLDRRSFFLPNIKTAGWEENIIPITVTANYVVKYPFNVVRPVPNTYIGFQLGTKNKYAKIFLGDMARITYAPVGAIREARLKPLMSKEYDCNRFIKVDDTMGIIINVFDNNKILCYLPEFDQTVFVDSGEVFELA